MNEYKCTIKSGDDYGRNYYILAGNATEAANTIRAMFPTDSFNVDLNQRFDDPPNIEPPKEETVICDAIICSNMGCMHRHPHERIEHCDEKCRSDSSVRCIPFINESPKIKPHNKECEYHGQSVETVVIDAWVYNTSNVIELRCIDICKQCGKGHGAMYTIFADKFVKEV